MQGLKLEELIEGNTYQCILSNRLVIIKHIKGKNGFGTYLEVTGTLYDSIDNRYKDITVFNRQLQSLITENKK